MITTVHIQQLLHDSIDISQTMLEELQGKQPDTDVLQKLMGKRSELFQKLEEHVYSDSWQEQKANENQDTLRSDYNKLAELDREIRNKLTESAKKNVNESDGVTKEIKAQHSYNKAGSRAGSSLFIEHKLHG